MEPPNRSNGEPPLEGGRRWFAIIINFVLWLFAVGGTLGALQVGRALWSGAVWMNFRGEAVTRAEMWRELVFFVLVVLVCAPLAWYWSRSWRRRS